MGKRKKTIKTPDPTNPQACPFPPKLMDTTPKTQTVPRALPLQSTSPFFKLGKLGILLLALSFTLIIFFTVFDSLLYDLWVFLNWNPRAPYIGVSFFSTISLGLVAISMTLSGFIFLNQWQKTGSRLALCIGLSFFLSAWWFVGADLLRYTGLVGLINYPYTPSLEWTFLIGPLYPLFFLLVITGFIFILTTMILWAIGMIRIPKHPEHQHIAALACFTCVLAAMILLFGFLNYAIGLFTPHPSAYDFWKIMFWIEGTEWAGASGFVTLVLPASLLSYIIFHKIPPRLEMHVEVSPSPQLSRIVVNPRLLHSAHLIFATPFVFNTSRMLLEYYRWGDVLGLSSKLTYLFIGILLLLVLAFNWYKFITHPNQHLLALSFLFFGFVTFLGVDYLNMNVVNGVVFLFLGVILAIHSWLPTRNWGSQAYQTKTRKIPGKGLAASFIIFGLFTFLLISVNLVIDYLWMGPLEFPLTNSVMLDVVIFPIIGFLIGLVFLIIGLILLIRARRALSESTNLQS